MTNERYLTNKENISQDNWLSASQVLYYRISYILNVLRENPRRTRGNTIADLDKELSLVLNEARAHGAAIIVQANLESLSAVVRQIDRLQIAGKLSGQSLELALEKLQELNEELRANLKDYQNRGIEEKTTNNNQRRYSTNDLPKSFSELIRLSDVLCKIMKNLPVDIENLSNNLRQTVFAFESMSPMEKSDYLSQINAAVVEANYKENRKKTNKIARKVDGYRTSFLADTLEVERIKMVNWEKTEEVMNKIEVISQQDTKGINSVEASTHSE